MFKSECPRKPKIPTFKTNMLEGHRYWDFGIGHSLDIEIWDLRFPRCLITPIPSTSRDRWAPDTAFAGERSPLEAA